MKTLQLVKILLSNINNLGSWEKKFEHIVHFTAIFRCIISFKFCLFYFLVF